MSKKKKEDNVDIASGIGSFDELVKLIESSNATPEHKELFSALCKMGSNVLQDIIVLDKQIKKAEHSRSKEGKEFLNVKATDEEDLKKMIEKILFNNAKSDGVCYCEFPEDEEPQPKKELKDFVWLPNNADQAYRESKAPSQLNQSCQKEAMLVDYVKKLKHEAENLFNEYDVALRAADKIKDDKVNYNYLLSQAFTNKKIAERLADIAADLGHILEEE